jgi:photosystem II stability/assembly factor-like uncharacterized protein
VFAIAWAGGVFRSGDDGNSWQKLSVGTRTGYGGDIGGFSSCICAAGEKIVIGVEVSQPVVYFSLDQGATWESRTISSQMPGDLVFLRYDNLNLYAGGFTGLYLSTDLGNSWTAQYSNSVSPEGKLIGLGIFRDAVSYNQTLIAAVDFNSLQLSRDNGKSWTSFNQGLISDWTFSALAVKSPYLWALTRFFGNAYRRSLTEIVTDVGSDPRSQPVEFSLCQNYPNPFNPATAISYQLAEVSSVTLRVFDLLGREITTLVNGQQSAGSHTVQWDGKNNHGEHVSSGIYLYELRAGTSMTTRKMVLAK